jgi:hypothetical protein
MSVGSKKNDFEKNERRTKFAMQSKESQRSCDTFREDEAPHILYHERPRSATAVEAVMRLAPTQAIVSFCASRTARTALKV